MTLEQKILLVEKSGPPGFYKKTIKKEKIDLRQVLTPSQYNSFLQKKKVCE